MMNRREFIISAGAALIASQTPVFAAGVPALTLTFDKHPETVSTAWPIMNARGLVGTFFVAPSTVLAAGVGAPPPPQCYQHLLVAMKETGWEIGVYFDVNAPAFWSSNGRVAFCERVQQQLDTMRGWELPVSSLAAPQRAWNPTLRGIIQNYYDRVRVADIARDTAGAWETLPVPDPLYIRGGGIDSLSPGDTVASLCARIDDLIALGGLAQWITHRVADSGDPNYRIPVATFTAVMDYIKTKRDAGLLQVVRTCDLPAKTILD